MRGVTPTNKRTPPPISKPQPAARSFLYACSRLQSIKQWISSTTIATLPDLSSSTSQICFCNAALFTTATTTAAAANTTANATATTTATTTTTTTAAATAAATTATTATSSSSTTTNTTNTTNTTHTTNTTKTIDTTNTTKYYKVLQQQLLLLLLLLLQLQLQLQQRQRRRNLIEGTLYQCKGCAFSRSKPHYCQTHWFQRIFVGWLIMLGRGGPLSLQELCIQYVEAALLPHTVVSEVFCGLAHHVGKRWLSFIARTVLSLGRSRTIAKHTGFRGCLWVGSWCWEEVALFHCKSCALSRSKPHYCQTPWFQMFLDHDDGKRCLFIVIWGGFINWGGCLGVWLRVWLGG